MTYKKHISRILTFCFRMTAFAIALTFLSTSVVQAVAPTPAELKALRNPHEWYDPAEVKCSEVPPGSSSGATVIEGSDNAKEAFLYFIKRGLTANQSAGIVGNLWAESKVIPDINEANPLVAGSRGGYGIAQWTASRRVAIESYAASTGGDLKSLQFQLDYLYDQELMKAYRISTLEPIRRSTTIREASNIFLHKFEAPADQSVRVENLRASYGEKFFSLYQADAASVTPGSAPGAPAEATGGTCQPAGAVGAGNGTFVGFPLDTTKARIAALNGGCFSDTTQAMCRGGHPYAAHDIFADPGTKVLSLLEGKVIGFFTDRCGGRSVSVYSASKDVTVSYLHLGSYNVASGAAVSAGQVLGLVGGTAAACGTPPHLHIDAATGQPRPGCSRLSCPAANQAKFEAGANAIGLAAGLYTGYKQLP